MVDKRKQVFLDRLSSLPIEFVIRLRDNMQKVCFDTFNYDSTSRTFCPIAIALCLDETIPNPTDEAVAEEIQKFFNPVNVLKGVKGDFYTTNRRSDLLSVCDEIINEKNNQRQVTETV